MTKVQTSTSAVADVLRKRVEKNISPQEARLKALLDQVPDDSLVKLYRMMNTPLPKDVTYPTDKECTDWLNSL